MRNRNIFIRKETAFSCSRGNGLAVFAHVLDYVDGNVYYEVDWADHVGRGVVTWHYGSNDERSGTYVKPLEEFLSRFAPDLFDEYRSYL